MADKLSWLQRLRICIEAACGLDYLHMGTGTRYKVIHHDVKTSNILMDENLTANILDFELAKISLINQAHNYVSTRIKGTFGYMDPSYVNTGKLTIKSDVYAFRVVLLEVLCERRAVDTTLDEKEWGLATWAQHCITKGRRQLSRLNCNNSILADETNSDIEASDEASNVNDAKMTQEASFQLMHVHASSYCTFFDVLWALTEKIRCNNYSSIYRVLQ
ncbi:concanavalin A-like lectin/glucanase [Tanacetum coccineum]